ncbi:cation/H(+) antiporter 2-like [Coffea eugenioides]|uniref:cation/H(+) antiporter 2-like n=1 Tax=Coffea eugenioides TaxID=49369 RepID=UPI000F60CA08|nr:cation/H(+) antiporter 2-like [Coffea eugenioides]
MSDPRPGACQVIFAVNPIISMSMQVSCILVISHFFHLLLKPLGQPGPVAQILAGFVIGPSGLSMIPKVNEFFFPSVAGDYYEIMAMQARIVIMFLIGLEMDFPYLIRNLRPVSIIAGSSCLMCTFFAIAMTSFIYDVTDSHDHAVIMGTIITVVLANTSSPIVVRLAADLKISTSDVGRMAISSSLLGDFYAVILLVIVTASRKHYSGMRWVLLGILYFIIVIAVIILNAHLAKWLNRRNRNQKYLRNTEVLCLLAIVFVTATGLETMGFSSIVACFLIGLMFPRGGKATRTLLIKLTYAVHNFILPVYFGYSGFRADLTSIDSLAKFFVVFVVILLSFGGKITGTLAACSHLKIPLNEGVLIAFLMNLKGHVDILTIGIAAQDRANPLFCNLMISAIVLNSLIWGLIITFMVRRESDILGYRHIAFESQSPDSELRLLTCVHGPRSVGTMVGLIAASKSSESIPVAAHLMHLIELPEKTNTNLMYHQKEIDEISDDDEYGGNDVVEINEAVDIFTAETGIMIHQVKVVSPLVSMYSDVCEWAEDTRASIIILPFHKYQRIDGKLESGKEGLRTTNQKILRHAPCSVAILVDRGLTAGASHVSGSESLQHVATLFFGGPDDREALGFSKRLGMHHHINLTIIRFLPTPARRELVGVNFDTKEKDILMAIPDSENDADAGVLTDFYNRYVTSGRIGYVEKYVENGAETASALRDMADMYAMFIVGKGGRAQSPPTIGLSDWEECPELGTVGDFLASPEFDLSGSVLVVQQFRPSKSEKNDP